MAAFEARRKRPAPEALQDRVRLKIRQMRVDRSWSQNDLAQRAGHGWAQTTVSKMESGQRRLRVHEIQAATYVLAFDGYPAPCLHCQTWALINAHDGCEHRGHASWRRWRVTHWLVRQLYVWGLSSSGGSKSWSSGGGCDGCLSSGPRWRGQRPYVLRIPRGTWRCWRNGHRRGDDIGLGFCAKCLPCLECGSTTAGHRPGCSGAL